MQELKEWVAKYFDQAENIVLLLLVIIGCFLLWAFGKVMAPFIASLVFAYILNGLTNLLMRYLPIKRLVLIYVLFILFIVLVIGALAILIPLISDQIKQIIEQVPAYFSHF